MPILRSLEPQNNDSFVMISFFHSISSLLNHLSTKNDCSYFKDFLGKALSYPQLYGFDLDISIENILLQLIC